MRSGRRGAVRSCNATSEATQAACATRGVGVASASGLAGAGNASEDRSSTGSSAARLDRKAAQQLSAHSEATGAGLQQQLFFARCTQAAAGPTVSAASMSITSSAVTRRMSVAMTVTKFGGVVKPCASIAA
jgi:hypothetical protein